MERVHDLVGEERAVGEIAQSLYMAVRASPASEFGAMLVTCADESELECAEALQTGFVRYLLPKLKFATQSAFRVANLGGRYEWGAIRIAEQHFATPASGDGFKLMLVKVNSHCAVEPVTGPGSTVGRESDRDFRLGVLTRYDTESPCCGALAGLLAHSFDPFALDLGEAFRSDGLDRIATLLDESRVDPLYRPLYAALASARLQARKAVLDIQDYEATTPTLWAVLPAVTMNRGDRDTEIVCGLYTVDGRQGGRDASWFGLGDDPAKYDTTVEHGRFRVTDDQAGRGRQGRHHRSLAWQRFQAATDGAPLAVQDERLERIGHDVAQNKHRNHHHARTLLRVALPVLAEVAPVPAAILMFAEGAAGIHHAFRIDRLVQEMSGSDEARRILSEVHANVDRLDPDRAEALIELLMREYRA